MNFYPAPLAAQVTTPSPSPTATSSSDPAVLTGDWLGDWLDGLSEGAAEFGALLILSLILYAVGRLVIRGVKSSIANGLPLSRSARKALSAAKLAKPELEGRDYTLEQERRRQRAQTIGAVLTSGLVVIIVVIIIAGLMSWIGIPLAPLIASAGIAGVALGFGAQSLVKDVLSGMFMLLEDQYGVGDVIDVGEAIGTVEEFGLRSTRLRSVDGTVWYVPNGEIRRVGNMTRLWSRALIEVRLSYDTNVAQAREAMFEAVTAAREDPAIDAAILSEPEIPGVEALDYDNLMMRMMMQCSPGTQWAVMRAIRVELRGTLKAHGVDIALPAGTMYMDRNKRADREPDGAHPLEDDPQ